jgi:hypothetical protein
MPRSADQRIAAIRAASVAPRIRLSDEQLRALRACSQGISLRFEEWEIVNALLEAGFAEMNAAGVIRVTEEGRQYLRS